MKKSVWLLAATLVAVGLAWSPATAGAGTDGAKAGSISAALPFNEVDPGVPVYVQGSVIGANTAYVIVQRKMASGWYDRATGTLDANKRFSIRIRPTGTGIYAFRVLTAGRTIASKTFYLRVWKSYLLYDQSSVDLNYNWNRQPATINTRYYPNSITAKGLGSTPAWVEYNLSRKYGRFQSAVGLDDTSPSGSKINYRVLGDGVQIASGQVSLGQRKVVDVSVSGVLRLRLEVTDVGQTSGEFSAWGNAKIKR